MEKEWGVQQKSNDHFQQIKIIERLLNSDEVAGRIVKDVAIFDMYLGVLIGIYFAPSSRYHIFQRILGQRMTFSHKVEALAKISFRRRYRSLLVIPQLRRFNRLRNLVAHKHFIGHWDIQELTSDHELMPILLAFPGAHRREVKLVLHRLRLLSSLAEFAHGPSIDDEQIEKNLEKLRIDIQASEAQS